MCMCVCLSACVFRMFAFCRGRSGGDGGGKRDHTGTAEKPAGVNMHVTPKEEEKPAFAFFFFGSCRQFFCVAWIT